MNRVVLAAGVWLLAAPLASSFPTPKQPSIRVAPSSYSFRGWGTPNPWDWTLVPRAHPGLLPAHRHDRKRGTEVWTDWVFVGVAVGYEPLFYCDDPACPICGPVVYPR